MDGIQSQDPDDLRIVLGLDQLQYLSEVTKSLNTLELPKSSGMELKIAVSEETTGGVIGTWYNIEDREWQLKLIN